MGNRREYDFTTPEGIGQFREEHLLPIETRFTELELKMRQDQNPSVEQLREHYQLQKTLKVVGDIYQTVLQALVVSSRDNLG